LQKFLVGGAVRDRLLGRDVVDRDWVVVGGRVDDMLEQGFKQKDPRFPVFEHPQTGDEYALARSETKTHDGHRGFILDAGPHITLDMDLARRDLTVNAMALGDDGQVVDPYDGQGDLRARVLRHVTPAFVEDPLRVLRLARFHAQLASFGFRIATETEDLTRRMAARPDMSTLSGPRIWAETRLALGCEHPAIYLRDLLRWGLVVTLLPEITTARGEIDGAILDALPRMQGQEEEEPGFCRLALLFAAGPAGDGCGEAASLARALAQRFSLGRRQRDLLHSASRPAPPPDATAESVLRWLEGHDGLRQPQRVRFSLSVRTLLSDIDGRRAATLCEAMECARTARPAPGTRPDRDSMRDARLAALAGVLEGDGGQPAGVGHSGDVDGTRD
jgi:tRNA nucleotidyltransferase (CCA-adding enzyme)